MKREPGKGLAETGRAITGDVIEEMEEKRKGIGIYPT